MPEIAMITFPIRRADLEYPTEDVPLVYWMVISKVKFFHQTKHPYFSIQSVDDFTDKAIVGRIRSREGGFTLRATPDNKNLYRLLCDEAKSTADIFIQKRINGSTTILATKDVDIAGHSLQPVIFSVSGSTIKGYHRDAETPFATVTDTDLVSGKIGLHSNPDLVGSGWQEVYIASPMSPLPRPVVLIEYDVVGDGSEKNPYRPDMPEHLVEIDKTMVTPEEWEALQFNPKGANGLPLVNRLAVTWGAIDYKGEPTMLCAIYSGSPGYVRKDNILRHIEHAKKKGYKVFKIPRSPTEARELWREIKRDRPDMLIEPEELTYQLIGSPELEPDSVACFYERELVNLNRIKGVPEWELERTLRRWEELAERYGRKEAKEKLRRVRRR